jgi:hypothetical protein
MDTVHLRASMGDVVVLDALRASSAERRAALPAARAAFVVRAWCVGCTDARLIARLYAIADDYVVGTTRVEAPRELVLRRVEEAIAAGRLLVLERPRRLVAVMPEDDADEEPLGPSPEREDVDFVLEYEDGTPVTGLRYVLVDPGGARDKGTLPASGEVQRKDVTGNWALSMTEFDLVEWEKRHACAGEEVTISVWSSGMDDGAAAVLRVYRLHDEDRDRAVAELPVTVQQGKATASWKYAPTARDESSAVSFVAEASAEGGRIWRKSEPLEVAIASVVSASWSQPSVAPGEDVELAVETLGLADGAQVSVTLLRHHVGGHDETLGDVPVPALKRRCVQAVLRCGDGLLPARAGDVYVCVTVRKDGVERTACSPLLWIDVGGAGAASGGPTEDRERTQTPASDDEPPADEAAADAA